MKVLATIALSAALLMLAGCDDGGGGGGGSSSTPAPPPPVNNTQPIQVNFGPANNDVDVPFTSVTICVPGSSSCQTISNIEIDTGSIGLRLIASQVSLGLPQVSDGHGNRLGNCIVFADNSYLWGPMAMADVQMAGEKAASVPIQLLGDASFATAPSSCSSGGMADDTISALGANGILGIGVFRQDCGSFCVSSGSANVYFSCPGGSCVSTTAPLASQLQNPVWMFPQDNNGFHMTLPAIPATGSPSVAGSLIFGIGTQSNNALSGAQVYTTDNTGSFTVNYNGVTYSNSFIDSGSNGIFFLDASTLGIVACTLNAGFYCPTSTQTYSVITTGANGHAGTVVFDIANADTLFASPNSAFNNLGGDNGQSFDLGLPFFFGRTVFIGIEGQSTPGGAGPYWAY
jgi:hypothetical protein